MLVFLASATCAQAIEWPISLAQAKAVGEAKTTNALAMEAHWLDSKTPKGPNAALATPFSLAAFVYSDNKATYVAMSPSKLREVKQYNFLLVTAWAFSPDLGANDYMVVVLKQKGKVIRPAYQHKDSENVTESPEVGYETSKQFRFPLSSFDYKHPFRVVLANAIIDGEIGLGETSWEVDPSKIR
jgi:hypothetical protein